MIFKQRLDDTFIRDAFQAVFPDDVFLKSPDNQVSPLSFYIRRGKKVTELLSDIHLLLQDKTPLSIRSYTRNKVKGEGKKSGAVEDAAEIAAGFLQSMGLSNTSAIEKELKKADEIAFSFPDLKRKGFSEKTLKTKFPPQHLDTSNATAQELLKVPPPILWFIRSVILSKSFQLHISGSTPVDLKAIKQQIPSGKGVSAKVQSKSIVFSRANDLVFGFSKVNMTGDPKRNAIIYKNGKDGEGQTPIISKGGN